MTVYEPQEDSDLLEKEVRKQAYGVVLDMGTGAGAQAIAAAERKEVKYVVAVDVNEDALEKAGRNAAKKNIKNIFFFVSDLFSLFDYYSIDKKGKLTDNKGLKSKTNTETWKAKAKANPAKPKSNLMKFDIILFNPPYLPQEKAERNIALEGGKKGYEIIAKFLERLPDFLDDDGICLLVFSSHTKKDVVDNLIVQQLLEFEAIALEKMFFEQLFVYKIKKSDALKELCSKGFSHLKYLAHGKRGIIHTAIFNKKKVAVKTKKKESEAVNRIENEAKWLRKLNKKHIGPKLVKEGELFLAYEFAEGEFFPDFLAKANKKDSIKAIHRLLQQCRDMDLMKVDKEEMHHPLKHIIVGREDAGLNIVMLDFERAHNTEKPKNVTQFCVYLVGDYIMSLLKAKEIEVDRQKVLDAAQEYKHEMSTKSFRKILSLFG